MLIVQNIWHQFIHHFNLTQTRSHFAKNFSADIKKKPIHTKYTVTKVFVSDSPRKEREGKKRKERAEQHRVLAEVSPQALSKN